MKYDERILVHVVMSLLHRLYVHFCRCAVQTRSLHGDPAAALLEVLDPEQNHAFVDQYPVIHYIIVSLVFHPVCNVRH